MKVDFFQEKCQFALKVKLFGICDNNSNKPAYIDIDNEDVWIATVINEQALDITFTALDNCIDFIEDDGSKISRCDAMIFYSNTIIFIELKDKIISKNEKAYEQLEATIISFLENHDVSIFKEKKAYVCNKKHKHFQVIANETQQRFHQKYKFRLHVEGTIKIV